MTDVEPTSPRNSRPSYGHSRARSKSSFSFKSAKSDSSDPSRPKINPEDLKESEATKRKAKWAAGQTAKDPNKAIREEQPADRAVHEANTLPALRQGQLLDWKGDVISDPDASNPTRPRMERPLDTIRSFEAAIDNNYRRKQKLTRSESADVTAQTSRRSSFVGGNENPHHNRYSTQQGGYGYGGPRGYSGYRDSYSHRPSVPRHATAPNGHYPPDQSVHSSHGYHESYDTVHTGESYNTSGSEPWTNSTDPSSENSSVDRMHGARPDYGDPYSGSHSQQQYGTGSARHDAIQEEYGHDGYGYTQGHYDQSYPQTKMSSQYGHPNGQQPLPRPPPPAPQHQSQHAPQRPQREVIPLGGQNPAGPPMSQSPGARLQRPPPPPKKNSSDDGKRKSWLRRRFSKS